MNSRENHEPMSDPFDMWLQSCPAADVPEGLRARCLATIQESQQTGEAGRAAPTVEAAASPATMPDTLRLHERKRTMFRIARYSSLAAAVVVAALAVGLLMSSSPSGYALAQTLEANRGVRFVHIQADPPGDGLADAWAQFDDEGRPLHLRLEFPKTEDGAKVVVWQKGKAEIWFKDKKSAVVVYDSKVLAQISQAFLNSQQVMERLYARAEAGLAKIEIMEPAGKGEPVRLTVVWPDRPALREVYLVDRETKLLRTMETYGKVDGDVYRFLGRLQYLGYNEPIDPAFFTLDLPPDVVRVDQTTQEIGLAKGDMTDNQVAVAVVRQFFEAVGAKDYAKARRMYEGIPAEKVKEIFGQADRVQIVSLGEPTPHARPETQFLCVPFEVELETGGTKSTKKGTAYVRPVYNHPDHWTINDGI